jgi:hypothetical protein
MVKITVLSSARVRSLSTFARFGAGDWAFTADSQRKVAAGRLFMGSLAAAAERLRIDDEGKA